MLKFGKALRVKLLDFQASVQKMKLKNKKEWFIRPFKTG